MRVAPETLGAAAAVTAALLSSMPVPVPVVPELRIAPDLVSAAPTPVPEGSLRYERLRVDATWQPQANADAAVFWGVPADLNAATAPVLMRLKGIGPALAAELEAARAVAGDFRTWDEVDAVRGIGPATLAQLQAAFFLPAAQP